MDKTDLPGELLSDPGVKKAFIALLEAQTLEALAEAKTEQEHGISAGIEARAFQRSELLELAKDRYHQVYQFYGEVDDLSVGNCMTALSYWSRTEPKCKMEIVFNSPGGSALAGLALFDFIKALRSQGHHITTRTLGHAASMAGILLQAGDTRVMGKEAWVLIHEISFSAVGKIGEIEDTTEWVKKMQKRILNIFAERSKMTANQIEKKWKRADWWLDSDQCLKLGLIDEIR